MSGRTKAACIGAAGMGAVLIALFAASQNAQFSALLQRLGPGGSAICGVTGTVLIQASVIPPLCSFSESTPREIKIYDYLKNPPNRQKLNQLIKNIRSRSEVRKLLKDSSSTLKVNRDRNLESLPNLILPLDTGVPNMHLIAHSNDSGISSLEFFRTAAEMNTRLAALQ